MSLKELRRHRSLWSPRTWLLYFLNKRLPTEKIGTLTDLAVDRDEQRMTLVLADESGPTRLHIRGYRLEGPGLRWEELSVDGPQAQAFRASLGKRKQVPLSTQQRLLAERCLSLLG